MSRQTRRLRGGGSSLGKKTLLLKEYLIPFSDEECCYRGEREAAGEP